MSEFGLLTRSRSCVAAHSVRSQPSIPAALTTEDVRPVGGRNSRSSVRDSDGSCTHRTSRIYIRARSYEQRHGTLSYKSYHLKHVTSPISNKKFCQRYLFGKIIKLLNKFLIWNHGLLIHLCLYVDVIKEFRFMASSVRRSSLIWSKEICSNYESNMGAKDPNLIDRGFP